MKKLVLFLLFILVSLFSFAQADTAAAATTSFSLTGFLFSNWAELLLAVMAFAKVVVRLTPNLNDDKVFGWLDDIISFFVPNLTKKSGKT